MSEFKLDREWYEKAADFEDGCIVSAGSPEMLDRLLEQMKESNVKGKSTQKKPRSKKA